MPSPEPRISYVVGRLDRALSLAVEERVAAHGLTLPQYTALSASCGCAPGLSNAQLARRTFVRPQSMMQVISKLEAAGLIERTPDADHGRILRTEITDAGPRGARRVRPLGDADGEDDARRASRARSATTSARRC